MEGGQLMASLKKRGTSLGAMPSTKPNSPYEHLLRRFPAPQLGGIDAAVRGGLTLLLLAEGLAQPEQALTRMLRQNGAVILARKARVFRHVVEHADLRQGGKQRVERFAADDAAHPHTSVHRRVNRSAAVMRRQAVILAAPVKPGNARAADLIDAANALIPIDHIVSDCKHCYSPPYYFLYFHYSRNFAEK